MARRIRDLDERDHHARVRVREQLRASRQRQQLTQKQVAGRLGTEAANLRRLERQGVDQSYAVTVMRWARALDERLVLQPVGFPPPAQFGDDLDRLLAAVAGEVNVGDEWAVARLMGTLTGIRIACRVTQPQLAKQFRTTVQSVSMVETAGSSTALVVLQRHARAIARCSWRPEAHLAVRLEPA